MNSQIELREDVARCGRVIAETIHNGKTSIWGLADVPHELIG